MQGAAAPRPCRSSAAPSSTAPSSLADTLAPVGVPSADTTVVRLVMGDRGSLSTSGSITTVCDVLMHSAPLPAPALAIHAGQRAAPEILSTVESGTE